VRRNGGVIKPGIHLSLPPLIGTTSLSTEWSVTIRWLRNVRTNNLTTKKQCVRNTRRSIDWSNDWDGETSAYPICRKASHWRRSGHRKPFRCGIEPWVECRCCTSILAIAQSQLAIFIPWRDFARPQCHAALPSQVLHRLRRYRHVACIAILVGLQCISFAIIADDDRPHSGIGASCLWALISLTTETSQ
jgi:hypothetical protein